MPKTAETSSGGPITTNPLSRSFCNKAIATKPATKPLQGNLVFSCIQFYPIHNLWEFKQFSLSLVGLSGQ